MKKTVLMRALLVVLPVLSLAAGCKDREEACDETDPNYTSFGCFLSTYSEKAEERCEWYEDSCHSARYTADELGDTLGITAEQATQLLASEGFEQEVDSDEYELDANELELLAMLAE